MRKIPTLFVRDPNDMRHVTRDVHPDCQWVIDGQGIPTRKYDGTCVMYDGQHWWARREVKPGKTTPDGFVAVEHDEATGKTVGWEPVEQSPWRAFLLEAIEYPRSYEDGTYELCGPKINGNPERFERHTLVRHADAPMLATMTGHRRWTFDLAVEVMAALKPVGWEGLVWHHPDGRMAKLKVRDFQ